MNSKTLEDEADRQLIRRFAEGRDERAFAKLVQRHGAIVAGVCARMLCNRDDADDAFQAVFLVFARRASALRRRGSLAGWLHEAAVRVCLNERRAGRRRQRYLRESAELVRENMSRVERMNDFRCPALCEKFFATLQPTEVAPKGLEHRSSLIGAHREWRLAGISAPPCLAANPTEGSVSTRARFSGRS